MNFREILQEERSSAWDTMRRENRRVAAASWGDQPPPKPTRPATNLTGIDHVTPLIFVYIFLYHTHIVFYIVFFYLQEWIQHLCRVSERLHKRTL